MLSINKHEDERSIDCGLEEMFSAMLDAAKDCVRPSETEYAKRLLF